jgi:hypothetical protein
MDDELQRRLAQELRATLATVVADDVERGTVAEELDAALALPPAESGRQVEEVLAAHAETRAWMRERDPAARDPDRLIGVAGGGLAGDPTADLGTHFVCPERDFDFVRETVATEVPMCPKHHVPLRPLTG